VYRLNVLPHIESLFQRAGVDSFEPLGRVTEMKRLADAFVDVSRRDDAIALKRRVLVSHEKVLGRAHRDTLASMRDLANTLRRHRTRG
jgi:hypothetical protein